MELIVNDKLEQQIRDLIKEGHGRPSILKLLPEATEWQVRTIIKDMNTNTPSTSQKPGMKILGIDIETSPNTVHVWGLFNQNVGLNQILDTSRVLCFAYKWFNEPTTKTVFVSEHEEGREKMLKTAWKLLDEADAVVHYNGAYFDIPSLNKEFLKLGLLPPSPYKQIDLLQTIRKNFKFVSRKLEHVLIDLNIGKKVEHEGHTLWTKCLAGDEEAWKNMKQYNIGDVDEMEKLYIRVLPWISNHPNHALYMDSDRPVCPNCGSDNLQSRGYYRTKTQQYRRFACTDCGSWTRERHTMVSASKRKNILTQAI